AGGSIQRDTLATGSNVITINAPLRLQGNYQFYNNNGDSGGFRIGGAISGTATAGNYQTLTLNGWSAASSNNVISGAITDGTNGGGLNVSLYGPSIWTLSGTSTITGRVIMSSGGANGILRNAGNLTAGGTPYDTIFRLQNGTFDNQGQLTLTGPISLDNNASRLMNSGTIGQSGGNRMIFLNEGSSAANSGVINLHGIAVGDWGADGGAANTATFTNNTGGAITVSELNVGKYKYGTFNNSGGNTTVSSLLGIGKADNGRTAAAGTNTFNLNSGTVTVNSGATFRLGAYNTASDATGIFNLNGGTLATAVGVTGPSGSNNTGTFNFNGGTLQATANNMTLLGTGLTAVNIRTNGATVDVGSGLTATISAN
ncbi:MAG: hypothetical protein EBU74_09915, partial [Betaproteobacteria bacterium]|nr:hypothetical protein [Betaproteobacteria bacterium]